MLVFQSSRLKRCLLTSVLVVAFALCTQAKEWRGIVPLHSTRSDVERELGKPAIAGNNFATYNLKEGRVSFDYATASCNEGRGVWNVPLGTVVSIVLTTNGDLLKIQNLRLDLTKFKKVQDEHVLNIFHYIDNEDGVRYEVDESDGTVPLIRYFQARKDEYLRCPTPKNKGVAKGAISSQNPALH